MYREIEIDDKVWPVVFDVATFYRTCTEHNNCGLPQLLNDVTAAKPEPLFKLVKVAIDRGRRAAEDEGKSYDVPENLTWEMIANMVGWDMDQMVAIAKEAANSVESMVASKQKGKSQGGKKTKPSTSTT